MGTDFADSIARRLCFVASQIVEDDDVARCQSWNQALLNPGRKGNAIDGAVEYKGRHDAITAQAGQKGQRLPVTMGHLCDQLLSPLTPAAGSRHVGLDPGLIDEDEPIRVKSMLMGLPPHPEPGHLRAILLACHQCFF